MKQVLIKITNVNDINEMVKIAREAETDVYIKKGMYCVDGKSLLGVFSIDMSTGVCISYNESEKRLDKFISKFKM